MVSFPSPALAVAGMLRSLRAQNGSLRISYRLLRPCPKRAPTAGQPRSIASCFLLGQRHLPDSGPQRLREDPGAGAGALWLRGLRGDRGGGPGVWGQASPWVGVVMRLRPPCAARKQGLGLCQDPRRCARLRGGPPAPLQMRSPPPSTQDHGRCSGPSRVLGTPLAGQQERAPPSPPRRTELGSSDCDPGPLTAEVSALTAAPPSNSLLSLCQRFLQSPVSSHAYGFTFSVQILTDQSELCLPSPAGPDVRGASPEPHRHFPRWGRGTPPPDRGLRKAIPGYVPSVARSPQSRYPRGLGDHGPGEGAPGRRGSPGSGVGSSGRPPAAGNLKSGERTQRGTIPPSVSP